MEFSDVLSDRSRHEPTQCSRSSSSMFKGGTSVLRDANGRFDVICQQNRYGRL